MNKRGLAFFLTMMITVVFILLALALASPINDIIKDTMAPSTTTSQGLDCANTSISDFNQATCIVTDLITPGFIAIIIGLAGLIITAKVVFSE